MAKISVIVLAFNVESYIAQCILSIRAQTFQDFEVIVVDDGSTDTTATAIRGAIGSDQRFQVIRNPANRGTFAARCVGASRAQAKHFCIVDGDDWLDPLYLERLYAAALQSGADVVECGVVAVDDDGRRRPVVQSEVSPRDATGPAILDAALRRTIWHVNWNKLIVRELFCQARPFLDTIDAHVTVADDKLFMIPLLAYAHKFHRISDALYRYRVRPGSATRRASHAADVRHFVDTLFVDEVLERFVASAQLRGPARRAMRANHENELLLMLRIAASRPRGTAERSALMALLESSTGTTLLRRLDRQRRLAICWMPFRRRPGDVLRQALNIARRQFWITCTEPGREILRS